MAGEVGALTGANFREATERDLPALHRLVERAYRGAEAKQGWSHEADLLGGSRSDVALLAESVADPTRIILLAEQHDAIVGCVEIADRGARLAYLGLLAVDPTLQTGGLGRQLLSVAEVKARDRFGATRIEMTVIGLRAALIAWYERRGYLRTGERRPFEYPAERLTDDDLSFVVLERALS